MQTCIFGRLLLCQGGLDSIVKMVTSHATCQGRICGCPSADLLIGILAWSTRTTRTPQTRPMRQLSSPQRCCECMDNSVCCMQLLSTKGNTPESTCILLAALNGRMTSVPQQQLLAKGLAISRCAAYRYVANDCESHESGKYAARDGILTPLSTIEPLFAAPAPHVQMLVQHSIQFSIMLDLPQADVMEALAEALKALHDYLHL